MTRIGDSGITQRSTNIEVPDDVRAELNTDERRRRAKPASDGFLDIVPHDLVSERDREARQAGQDLPDREAEGRPPAEEPAILTTLLWERQRHGHRRTRPQPRRRCSAAVAALQSEERAIGRQYVWDMHEASLMMAQTGRQLRCIWWSPPTPHSG